MPSVSEASGWGSFLGVPPDPTPASHLRCSPTLPLQGRAKQNLA